MAAAELIGMRRRPLAVSGSDVVCLALPAAVLGLGLG